MKHLGTLLLIIIACVYLDLRDKTNSALLGTGYHSEYQKLVPFGGALVIWVFVESIYWIIFLCFL